MTPLAGPTLLTTPGVPEKRNWLSEDVVANVRDHIDIVEVIGRYVQLRRTGVNYKGLCPFHEEKTPSFTVNAQRQFFHCFGCQQSGDVFAFLMKIEGRRFGEVMEDLAQRAGISLPRQPLTPAAAKQAAQRRSEKQQGIELNKRVAQLYQQLLWRDAEAEAACAYLQQRGISRQIAEQFQLGYAPGNGATIVRCLPKWDILPAFAEKMGLVAPRRQGGGYHDRFWGRLMFPLVGIGDEVIGFSGRVLGKSDGPKYINSPETPLYRKGEALYGIAWAAKGIRQEDGALLVEGNIDVIQLHQAGFSNAVAPLGTALTAAQLQLLHRFSGKVTALFDGDSAGQAAARRSVSLFIEAGMEARIASLPTGQDPDSLVHSSGATALQAVLDAAAPVIDFFISDCQKQFGDSVPAKSRVLQAVGPILVACKDAVMRDLYVDKLASLLGIDRNAVLRALRSNTNRAEPVPALVKREGPNENHQPLDPRELDLLAVLMDHPSLLPRAESIGLEAVFINRELAACFSHAVQLYQQDGALNAVKWLSQCPNYYRNQLADAVLTSKFSNVSAPERAFEDCINALQRQRLQREQQAIKKQILEATQINDVDLQRTLALRLIDLEREIHETR